MSVLVGTIILVFVVSRLLVSVYSEDEYRITTTWNNEPISHPSTPVVLRLRKHDNVTFKIVIEAPFYDDPGASGRIGEPFYGLWHYEVVEIFFLNDRGQYVMIELSPKGQYDVLLWNGYGNLIRRGLLLTDYKVWRNYLNSTWRGEAFIPVTYLPSNVIKMNAYAIHRRNSSSSSSQGSTVLEALYATPSDGGERKLANKIHFPDFESFRKFDRRSILSAQDSATADEMSPVWKHALQKLRRFRITHAWNGTRLPIEEAIDLRIGVKENHLILNVNAPFYHDPPPPSSATTGGPFPRLDHYEVVRFFLLNRDNRYLEIQLGPYGHYRVAFHPYWNGFTHLDKYPIKFSAKRQGRHWNGTAIIPLNYLPPRVRECNAHSSHGQGEQRKTNSLFFLPPKSGYKKPDLTLLQYFRAIDLSLIYPGNEKGHYSDVWQAVADDFNFPSYVLANSKQLLVAAVSSKASITNVISLSLLCVSLFLLAFSSHIS